MLIHTVFKISSDTRVKLTSTVTDINVPQDFLHFVLGKLTNILSMTGIKN
jgi:hypothetical protein